MDVPQLDTTAPSALRLLIAKIARLPLVEPIARRLRSHLSETKFVTFPLGEMGRFGNQLFQIAATIGIARRNGCPFVFPIWPYSRHFEFPIPQSRFIRQFERRMPLTFAYEEIVIDRATELAGFFQSERYFTHCEEEVRHYFTPHHVLADLLERQFGDLLATKTCSVHVRRTDYIGDPAWPELAMSDYYERAMSQFDSDTRFLIFSDDIEWCQQRFRGREVIFIEALSAAEDLFLMARCKGHIIANSTFSWWGAWLDPNPTKRVIAPLRWFAGKHADPAILYRPIIQDGFCDTTDLIPSSWIRI
ncbi:alpha-1,2-fucosyltransferase [Candidatus Binatus sp.]|uniref:alpha-1,2-fucosyltransferase n=1 Tax=Candidatus Binatus sp. TaxID=2811406 RepID=UPI003BB0E1CF